MSSPSPMRNIVLRFDMRSSTECPDTPADRYMTALEMARWADRNTVDVIGLSEHHDTIDGFLSAPLQLAGMMIAATHRIRISVSALLVPLHDPLRLAEDIAMLDIVARGRFTATCGLGYRESEYECFGIDWANRGRVFDEKLEVLVNALKGQSFNYNGRESRLNPAPVSPLYSLLTIGGNSKAAARRAARFGLFFAPPSMTLNWKRPTSKPVKPITVNLHSSFLPERQPRRLLVKIPKLAGRKLVVIYSMTRQPTRPGDIRADARTPNPLHQLLRNSSEKKNIGY